MQRGPFKTSPIIVFLVGLSLLPRAFAGSPSPTADSLVAAAKQATGGAAWDHVVTWHEMDKITAGGLTGTAESWADFPTLHNAESYSLGPTSGSSGWDGVHVWTTDSSKEVRIESSEEAVAGAIQSAYLSGWAFLFAGRFPDTREYVGTRQADGQTFDAVKVTPKGADPFEIWFNPATHCVDREVQLTGGQPQTFLLRNYTPVGGLVVPYESITRVANDPKYDIVSQVKSIELVGSQPISRYAPPPPPENTAQWSAGQDSTTVPFRLINNHIYVDASINGQPPVPFVFDTGATNIIAEKIAKKFGIGVEGALPSGGFGNNVSSMGMARIKSVSIGGLTLPEQVFGTMGSGGWMAVEGAAPSGLLGYEFAKRAVLKIDYANRTLTFAKPSAFSPPAGVAAVPFTFSDHTPMIPATLDGNSGEFELDTGSRGALTLMAPFARAHGLVDKYNARVAGTVGYGVGGPARALLARGGALVIGPVTVKGPVAEIVTNASGGGNEMHKAGNIGGDILKRFTVTLDYAHQLAWFQPNALNDQPEVFDRSGLWIARADDSAIAIADVTTASPAAKAGLVVGDEIVTVAGKPAKDIALYDLREEFKGPVGATIKLRIKSKTGLREVTLTLADQV